MPEAMKEQEKKDIFALDIGTRSIIGVVGRVESGRFHVLAIEKENHGQRAMLDGQIEDIERVAAVAGKPDQASAYQSLRCRRRTRTEIRKRQLSSGAARHHAHL